MKNNRIGKLYIRRDIFENVNVPKLFYEADFCPIRAEFLYHKNSIEYIGISKYFDYIKLGGKIPEYKMYITTYGYENEFEKFEKIKGE